MFSNLLTVQFDVKFANCLPVKKLLRIAALYISVNAKWLLQGVCSSTLCTVDMDIWGSLACIAKRWNNQIQSFQ